MIKIQYKHGLEYRLRETLKAFKVEKVYITTEDRTLAIEALPKDVSLDEMSKWTTVEKVKADVPKKPLDMAYLAGVISAYNDKRGNKSEHKYSVLMVRNGDILKARLKKRNDGSVAIEPGDSYDYNFDVVSQYVKDHPRDSMALVAADGSPVKDVKFNDEGKIVFTF